MMPRIPDADGLLEAARLLRSRDLRRCGDAELLACVRASSDVMFLLSCGMIGTSDDEQTQRDYLLRRVYPSLERRYARPGGSLSARWALLDARFRTLHYAALPVDGRQRRCYEDLDRLLSATDPSGLQGDDLYAALGMTVHAAYGYSFAEDGDDTPDPRLSFLRETVAAWASALSPDGSWPGVDADTALRRLQIMDMDAVMLRNPLHEAALRRAFARYALLPLPAAGPVDDATASRCIRMYDTYALTPQLAPAESSRLLDRLALLLATREDLCGARAVVLSHGCRLAASLAGDALA